MKRINIREALLSMDRATDCEFDLTSLYEACCLDDKKKEKLVQYIDAYDIDATNKFLSNEATSQGLMEEVADDLSDDELKDIMGEAVVHMTDETTFNPLVRTQSLKVGDMVYDEDTGHKCKVLNIINDGKYSKQIALGDTVNQRTYTQISGNNALWEVAVEGDTAHEVDDDDIELHSPTELLSEEVINEELWDASRANELVTYYLDGGDYATLELCYIIMNQMKEEGRKLPYNITDFFDTVYKAVYEYNKQFEDGSINEEHTQQPMITESDEWGHELTPLLRKLESDGFTGEFVWKKKRRLFYVYSKGNDDNKVFKAITFIKGEGNPTIIDLEADPRLSGKIDFEEPPTHCVYFSLDGGKTHEVEFKGTEVECQQYLDNFDHDEQRALYGNDYPERFIKKLGESVDASTELITTYKDELELFLRDKHFSFEFDIPRDDTLVIDIEGDWKHDHLYLDTLVRDFFADKGLTVTSYNYVTEEDGSDYYRANHCYKFDKPEEYDALVLSLQESIGVGSYVTHTDDAEPKRGIVYKVEDGVATVCVGGNPKDIVEVPLDKLQLDEGILGDLGKVAKAGAKAIGNKIANTKAYQKIKPTVDKVVDKVKNNDVVKSVVDTAKQTQTAVRIKDAKDVRGVQSNIKAARSAEDIAAVEAQLYELQSSGKLHTNNHMAYLLKQLNDRKKQLGIKIDPKTNSTDTTDDTTTNTDNSSKVTPVKKVTNTKTVNGQKVCNSCGKPVTESVDVGDTDYIFCVDCDNITLQTYKGPFKDGYHTLGRYICTRCGCENNDEVLEEDVNLDSVVTIGIYGDEDNSLGITSMDELVNYFQKKGIEVISKDGDMDYGWDLGLRGNPRDIFLAVNNNFTGYNCSSVQEFVDQYQVDDDFFNKTVATRPEEGDGTQWYVGDDTGRVYYSKKDAEQAYKELVDAGFENVVMEPITESIKEGYQLRYRNGTAMNMSYYTVVFEDDKFIDFKDLMWTDKDKKIIRVDKSNNKAFYKNSGEEFGYLEESKSIKESIVKRIVNTKCTNCGKEVGITVEFDGTSYNQKPDIQVFRCPECGEVSDYNEKSNSIKESSEESDDLKFVDNRKKSIISGNPWDDPGFDEYDITESSNERVPMLPLDDTVDLEYSDLTVTHNTRPSSWNRWTDGDDWEEHERKMDYTLTVDKEDIITFLIEECVSEDDVANMSQMSDDELEQFIINNFDKLFTKYEQIIKDEWEEEATERATEHYIENQDYYD